jgi:hypothetical protein
MALTTPQRFGAYFAGFGLGCIIVSIILSIRGLPHPPVPPPPGVIRREVPGALTQWMQNHQHIEGDFVLTQSDDLHAPTHEAGLATRCVVVPGLDPGAFIRVEEKSTLTNPDVVTDWKFMFADRVRLKLVSPADSRALADAMHSLGWQFLGDRGADGSVSIVLAAHEVHSVPDAIARLKSWPQWVADAEPDYLPAPTGWHGN